MLTQLTVKNFKALKDATIKIAPLTVFVGPNSSGKSTALQAALLTREDLYNRIEFSQYLRNMIVNPLSYNAPAASEISIQAYYSNLSHPLILTMKDSTFHSNANLKPCKTTFLSADRIGPRATYEGQSDIDIDMLGSNTIPFLQDNKNKKLQDNFIVPDSLDATLFGQVNHWLKFIVDTEIQTKSISPNIYTALYNHNDAPMPPTQTGFGTSVLLPVLLACLMHGIEGTESPIEIIDHMIIIENPEIHLHPQTQAKLATFFAFIASTGIQVILETHCEHLIYKLCHEVYNDNISHDKLIFQYKESTKSDFIEILVNAKGRFVDVGGEYSGFPSGFFDATLRDYLAMYRQK